MRRPEVEGYKAVVIVPGLPLYTGPRDNTQFSHRSTRMIRNVITPERSLPVRAHEWVVGRALSMDYVEVDGEPSLLFRVVLARPAWEFRRRPDGALVGSIRATGWVTGIFPHSVFVEVAQ